MQDHWESYRLNGNYVGPLRNKWNHWKPCKVGYYTRTPWTLQDSCKPCRITRNIKWSLVLCRIIGNLAKLWSLFTMQDHVVTMRNKWEPCLITARITRNHIWPLRVFQDHRLSSRIILGTMQDYCKYTGYLGSCSLTTNHAGCCKPCRIPVLIPGSHAGSL